MESFVSEFKALEDLFTTEEEEEKKSVEPSPVCPLCPWVKLFRKLLKAINRQPSPRLRILELAVRKNKNLMKV